MNEVKKRQGKARKIARKRREKAKKEINKARFKRPSQAKRGNRIEALEKRLDTIEEFLNLEG